MKIRSYQPDDWDRCCEIHDAARIDELRGSVDLAAFLTLEQTAENEGLFDGQLLVAELDQEVAGFIAFDDEEVTWLYVHPEYYRQGIARQLLQFVIEITRKDLKVEVLSNNLPALKLYEDAGFNVIEKRHGKLTGNEQFSAEGYIMKLTRLATD